MTSQEHYSSSIVRNQFKLAITKSELDTMRSVLNHVWILTDTQKSICDKYFLMQSTVSTLHAKINKDHNYLDFISIQDSVYRMNYINGSTGWLADLIDKDLGHTPVLMSFRGSRLYHTFSCLVLLRDIGSDSFNVGEL